MLLIVFQGKCQQNCAEQIFTSLMQIKRRHDIFFLIIHKNSLLYKKSGFSEFFSKILFPLFLYFPKIQWFPSRQFIIPTIIKHYPITL